MSQEGLERGPAPAGEEGPCWFHFREESFIFNTKTIHNSCKTPEKYKEDRKHHTEFPHRIITPGSTVGDTLPKITSCANTQRR